MSILGNNLLAQYYAQQQDEVPPDNEVWYWADEQVKLYQKTNVVSHTFENGKGTIKYNSPLTNVPRLFVNYSAETSVVLPDSATAGSIYMLYYQTAILSARLSRAMTAIPSNAFNGDTSLTTCRLYDNVKIIGAWAFYNCSKLRMSALPKNVESIEANAFCGCDNMSLTALPPLITSIGERCFFGCTKLDIASFPVGVTVIPQYSFHSTGIKNLMLHAGIQTIGEYAFYNNLNLQEVVFIGTPLAIASHAFDFCYNLTTIRVPWSEGEVANAPWGATNATIIYNYQS